MTIRELEDLDSTAADYALGVLTDEERAAVEAQLERNSTLATLVDQWRQRLAPLSDLTKEVEPPPDIFDRIETALDRSAAAGADISVTIREDEGRWIDFAPGARRKILYFDEKARKEAYILELDPGTVLPDHDHHATEDCLVLSGDFWIGDLELKAGDFHAAFASSKHAASRSVNGCRLFIKAAA